MSKEFIPYEEALDLKELGYDKISRFGNESSLYDKDGEHVFYSNYGFMYSGLSDGYISAPLYQQAFRWFREKYNIDAYPQRCGQGYAYQIYVNFGTKENESIPQKGWCDTYEEAELACLRKLIEIVNIK